MDTYERMTGEQLFKAIEKMEQESCPRNENQGRGPDCPCHPRESDVTSVGESIATAICTAVVVLFFAILIVDLIARWFA